MLMQTVVMANGMVSQDETSRRCENVFLFFSRSQPPSHNLFCSSPSVHAQTLFYVLFLCVHGSVVHWTTIQASYGPSQNNCKPYAHDSQ